MLKRWLQNPVILILASLITLSIIFSLRKNLERLTLSEQNLATLKSEVNKLEKDVSSKQQELKKAKQPLTKEKIARNELLLKKEGELVIQLPEIELPEDKDKTPRPTSNWQKWKKLLLE